MNAWSNIQISPEDIEIDKINNIEKKLGKLPERICRIRELITRFEVCHFKYKQHLEKIKNTMYIQKEMLEKKIQDTYDRMIININKKQKLLKEYRAMKKQKIDKYKLKLHKMQIRLLKRKVKKDIKSWSNLTNNVLKLKPSIG